MSEQEVLIGCIKPIPRYDDEADSIYFERVTSGNWIINEHQVEDIEDAIHQNKLTDRYMVVDDIIYETYVSDI